MRCKTRRYVPEYDPDDDIIREMRRQRHIAKALAAIEEREKQPPDPLSEYECTVRLPDGERVTTRVVVRDEDPTSAARRKVAAERGLDVMDVAPSLTLFVRDVEHGCSIAPRSCSKNEGGVR